ncbi:MAG: carbonic anhydrase [Phycisphaerae bacterium]|nr:carbonic anhydrase [Phycisphaerae bacterium]MDW8263516.1 carbonic anhydrase [Phycisphaerales bacterium]
MKRAVLLTMLVLSPVLAGPPAHSTVRTVPEAASDGAADRDTPSQGQPSGHEQPASPKHSAAPGQTRVPSDSSTAPHPTSAVDAAAVVPAPEALQRLIDGNDRFRHGESTFRRYDSARRQETFAHGQKPFAAVLSCADSRVPVEAIFDQGIGDLFVARVAGNVATEGELASMEYAIEHLQTRLIVVLGHTRCGAVTAAAEGADPGGHVGHLLDHILPAVQLVRQQEPDVGAARLIRLATRANVQQSMHQMLVQSPRIASAVKSGRVRIIGGVYDLQTGGIDWLGEHPRQSELLSGASSASDAQQSGQHSTSSHHPKGAREHSPASAVAKPAPHGSSHASPASQPAGQSLGKHAPRQENWVALGTLLTISAVASFGTIHLFYGRA